jgi:hypothetical protein
MRTLQPNIAKAQSITFWEIAVRAGNTKGEEGRRGRGGQPKRNARCHTFTTPP